MTKEDIKKALELCTNDEDCEKCPYCDTGCTRKLRKDSFVLIIEQEKEIERLKSEYEQLQTNAEILARGVRDLNHENYELTNKVKQAKIDVLNKVKEKVYPFLQAEMYNKKHFIAGDSVNDKLRENQNIGILIAQDVLSKWFKVKIDELIKEIEK